MGSLTRLIPFIMRQRWALCVSIVLSIGVALFTAAQLSLIFPALKLLLEGKDCSQHVHEELAKAEQIINRETNHVAAIEVQLKDQVWLAATPKSDIGILRDELSRAQVDLKGAAWSKTKYSWVESKILPWVPQDKFELLAFLLGALLVLTLFKETCSFLQEFLIGSLVQRIMQSLRERLFRSTLKLDQQTLALETTPNLMARFTFDLSQVAHGLSLMGSKIVVEPIRIAFLVGCAFATNWRLTLLALVCVPPLAALFGVVGKKLKRAAQRQMESMSNIYRVLEEALSSLRTVQAFRNERIHRQRLRAEHHSYFEKALRILRIDALVSPSVEFLAMCAVFVASLPGAYLVLRQKTSIWGIQLAATEMSISDLGLLYIYLMGTLDPGRKLSGVYSKLKRSAAACTRVFSWMDKEPLVATATSPQKLPRHAKSIEFDRVTFHYAVHGSNELGRRALDEISLTIPFGATVAVVGENGSGKSTLTNLLPRFYDPHVGQVRIDGVDITEVDLSELRRQIGVVTQDTLLFDWSIAENIRYGEPNASETELQAAADQAHVTDFVTQMPDGLQTEIGDRGHRLSGGQRQRVALARAILRDPAILILDEATSAIDTQSEQCIHQALLSFAKQRTTFIVTHAMTPSLLELVSHVLVMDRGRVVAFGAHDVVLRTSPIYQRLFDAQMLKRAG